MVAPCTKRWNGTYEIVDPTVPVFAPRWLEDLVEKRPYDPVAPNLQAMTTGWAEIVLDKLCDQLAGTQHPGRNDKLNTVSFALGRLGAYGVLEKETAWRRLWDACAVNGLRFDEGGESACRATFESGWNSGRDQELAANE